MDNTSEFPNPVTDGRSLHHRQPIALVLCNEADPALGKLTARRSKAALPFAGKYRLIDFALSNCVNSGIETVGVITQYQPRSLHAHLAYGCPWGLDRRESGLTLLHPYQTGAEMGWYTGTADALHRNQDFVLHYRVDEVLILSGGEVCIIDLDALVSRHRAAGADLTIAAVAVGERATTAHGTLILDHRGWVRSWIPPESAPPGSLAVTGVLLFSKEAMGCRLSEDVRRLDSTHDLFRDLIPHMIRSGDRVMAFRHTGYWSGLHTVQDYWQAHMDLVAESSLLDVGGEGWPIRTRFEVRPPTRVSIKANVSRSLLSEGCGVEGIVERSILSPGVHVAPGAVVRSAVVMHDTVVQEGALVEYAILDSDVIVGRQARVGAVDHHSRTRCASRPERLVIVEQGAHIPARAVVEPDALIADRLLPNQRRSLTEAQMGVAC
jgi:glucose-1-phosphate adenylyltransferase